MESQKKEGNKMKKHKLLLEESGACISENIPELIKSLEYVLTNIRPCSCYEMNVSFELNGVVVTVDIRDLGCVISKLYTDMKKADKQLVDDGSND
jgi:hypothetical protein